MVPMEGVRQVGFLRAAYFARRFHPETDNQFVNRVRYLLVAVAEGDHGCRFNATISVHQTL